MRQQNVYIAPSPIHGRGVFARRPICRGEVIGKITGYKTRRPGTYVLWLSEYSALRVCCELRYLNHAETANACILETLEVVALEDIRAGTEITHNYNQ